MQLSVIRTRISQRLAEGGTPVFYTASSIDAAINEGSRLFALLTLGLEQTSTWTPSGTTFSHMMSIFPDWIAPLRLATAAGATVRPSTLADLNSLDPAWIFASGTPERYVSLGADYIGVYKVGGTLSVTYARAPLALVLDVDVPEFPVEYHTALVSYGIYRCRQQEGSTEFQKALKYLDEFYDAAQHFGDYVRNRNKGSRYDRGPFELARYRKETAK